jgi:L-alanine-DL-glutamate epimerase-like enolase superfamily enzyme
VIGIGVTATEQARAHAAEGIGTLKMKVGHDVTADIRRVWAVRTAVGDGVRLRLDGNAGLSLADALALVRGVADLGVELFEQPVRADDLHGMRTLREAGARILADESVHSLRDAIRVLEAGAADALVVKLIKCGGLRAAREIAAAAAAYGAEVIFVSPYETAVGMATTASAAAAFGTRRHAHDLFRTLQDGGGAWEHAAVPGGIALSATAPGHGAAVGAEAAEALGIEDAELLSR